MKKLKCVNEECNNIEDLKGGEYMSPSYGYLSPPRALNPGRYLVSCSKCECQMIIIDV